MADTSTKPIDEVETSDPSRLPPKPVVSVLMPTYNHGAFLAEAIEGVLKQQSDFPFELLIGEDCSTDDTREIALRYQCEHPDVVRVITSNSNVGARCNRRRLARAVRGEFIAFCEGDDYWTDPAKLQLQVDYLRAHRDVGAVHSDIDRVVLRSGSWRTIPNFKKRTGVSIPQGDVFSALLVGNFIHTCTLCVRADLDRQYFASDLPADSYPISDWPLYLYIAARSKIAYLDRSLAAYRQVAGSAMNSGHKVRAQMVARYVPMIEDLCDLAQTPAAERTAALAKLYRNLFWFALFADDLALFGSTIAWLRQCDPTYLLPLHKRLIVRFAWLGPLRKLLTLTQGIRQTLNERLSFRAQP